MDQERNSTNTLVIAVIGALATVLVGVVPIVVGMLRASEPTTVVTSPSPPIELVAEEPYSLGDDVTLDRLADACYDFDLDACDQLFNVSPAGSDYEWYGGTCGGIFDEIIEDLCSVFYEEALLFLPLVESCDAGDMAACDQLYQESPTGSLWEEYGATCGERLADPIYGYCSEEYS